MTNYEEYFGTPERCAMTMSTVGNEIRSAYGYAADKVDEACGELADGGESLMSERPYSVLAWLMEESC